MFITCVKENLSYIISLQNAAALGQLNLKLYFVKEINLKRKVTLLVH